VFLGADTAATIDAVRQGLEWIGLDVYVASPDSGSSVALDYENARYLIVFVVGTADSPPSRASTIASVATGIKTIVFPGAPMGKAPEGSVQLDLADEMWLKNLAAAILYVA
jgi:hypothetical protein